MTSNVSSFACLAEVVVIIYVHTSHLSALTHFSCRHSRCSKHSLYYNVHYTAGTTVVYHVFLCVVCHFSSIAFLCDTTSMEEELLYLPRLPSSLTWISPDTPVHKVCSSGEECGIFSDSGVIDLTKEIRAVIR